MTMRLWRYEDLNEIASLESECFSQDPWNVRIAGGVLPSRPISWGS